jgi:acyl-CoA thioesterase
MFDGDTAAAAAGITVEVPGPGHARARMTITGQMLNGHGTCHGGYLFLLADTAFACACNSHGKMAFAAAANITFLIPAYAGDVLTAEAAERSRSGRNGVYDVTVARGEGEVVAEFRGQSRMTSVPLSDGQHHDDGHPGATA